jgi:uncharacterized protein
VSQLAYVDASALVKLFIPEFESEAMEAALHADWPAQIASEILAVEISRVALKHRGPASSRAIEILRPVALMPLTPQIRADAARIRPPALRTLDAIHLATALSARDQIGAVFTYDTRLADACRDAGLRVLAPA